MNVLEPDVTRWTTQAIAEFLASPAAEGLTAEDLTVYVAMRRAAASYERCGVTAALMTKKDRELRESAYQAFRQARARWSAVRRGRSPTTCKRFQREEPMGRGKDTQAFLVAHSAGHFRVTKAGRDALVAARIKSYPARFEVRPGTALANSLIALADGLDGCDGRVPKSLRTAHERAKGTAAAAGRAVERLGKFETRLDPKGRSDLWRSAPAHMLRKVELRDRIIAAAPPGCSVCGAVVAAGGRKMKPSLCARCYVRERRGQPPAKRSSTPKLDASITVQLPAELKRELERCADSLDESVSTFVLELVRKAVKR